MKIIQINKYITLSGGSESVMSNLTDLLIKYGNHDVLNIGFTQPNYPLIPNSLSLGPVKQKLTRFFWDEKIVSQIVDRIIDFSADLIITHNIYHDLPLAQLLTQIKKKRPSIYLVSILHDPKPVCPIHTLLREGMPCDLCKDGHFYNCVIKKCKDQSYIKSLLLCCDSYWNTIIYNGYKQYDLIISPSHFLRNKCFELGFKHPIKVLHNPVKMHFPIQLTSNHNRNKSVLYAGRLSLEKGVHHLIEAALQTPEIQFIIAGTGPLQTTLQEKAKNAKNIRFIGHCDQKTIQKLLNENSFMVIPSIWAENNPMIILEAFSQGCIVLGSNLGGIPELLSENRGLTFSTGNAKSIQKALEDAFILDPPHKQAIMENAFKFVQAMKPENYYQDFIKLIGA